MKRILCNLIIYIQRNSIIIFIFIITWILVKHFIFDYHEQVYVYSNYNSPANHFIYRSLISTNGKNNSLPNMDENWRTNPYSGNSCIRCSWKLGGQQLGGWYFLNNDLNNGQKLAGPSMGDIPNAGYDLNRTYKLTFWAKGETGEENIEFFCAGIGHSDILGDVQKPYPDSSEKISMGVVQLTRNWRQYSMDLKGKKLGYVLCGFGWSASSKYNSKDVIFYLEDISYYLQRKPNSQTRLIDIPEADN